MIRETSYTSALSKIAYAVCRFPELGAKSSTPPVNEAVTAAEIV